MKSLVRAHRWQRMLDGGERATVAALAAAERVNASYASRVPRLTLLAPGIVAAILEGRRVEEKTLAGQMGPFPMTWTVQKFSLLMTRPPRTTRCQ